MSSRTVDAAERRPSRWASMRTRTKVMLAIFVVVLLAVSLGQGTIGFVQYFTDLPEILVGFHMLGAALVSAAVTWVLLTVIHEGGARRP